VNYRHQDGEYIADSFTRSDASAIK
jgi:hypothetical protein